MNSLPEYGKWDMEGDCCFLDGTFKTKEHVNNIFYVLEMEKEQKQMIEYLGCDPYAPCSWCCICGGMGSENGKCWGCQ